MHYFIVDAFTDQIFSGNPAGVCVMDTWPEIALMQKIAAENNLPETAFVVKTNHHYHLRWFTPTMEVPLCGHGTLATAYVLANYFDPTATQFEFTTEKSGSLHVEKKGELFELNFPIREQTPTDITETMQLAVNAPIKCAYHGYNLMLELADEQTVQTLQPNLEQILNLTDYHGVIVTAKGDCCDFISRFFAPVTGSPEDPVTGSTHTVLIPFWAQRLGKNEMLARQLSARGGTLHCKIAGDRVYIAGTARIYLKGTIQLSSN